jgi:hypothetical protein
MSFHLTFGSWVGVVATYDYRYTEVDQQPAATDINGTLVLTKAHYDAFTVVGTPQTYALDKNVVIADTPFWAVFEELNWAHSFPEPVPTLNSDNDVDKPSGQPESKDPDPGGAEPTRDTPVTELEALPSNLLEAQALDFLMLGVAEQLHIALSAALQGPLAKTIVDSRKKAKPRHIYPQFDEKTMYSLISQVFSKYLKSNNAATRVRMHDFLALPSHWGCPTVLETIRVICHNGFYVGGESPPLMNVFYLVISGSITVIGGHLACACFLLPTGEFRSLFASKQPQQCNQAG